jgi:hypothetical protein
MCKSGPVNAREARFCARKEDNMGFFLILDKAQIHKRHEFLNTAEVKFYSFVNDGLLSLPGLDRVLKASDPQAERATIREMAKHVLNQWESVEVQNVQAGHIFRFGDTGRILYRSQGIPETIDWIMLAIEVDQDVRSLGEKIDQILPDDQVDSLAGNIMKLASIAASPQTAAAIALGKALIRGVTFFLKNDENDQLGLIEQSFIRQLHYPDGKRTGAGVQDLTGNMWYDYTVFGVEGA